MLKNLKNVQGTSKLSKKKQKAINGGYIVFVCEPHMDGWQCAAPSGNLGTCMGGECYDC